MTKKLSSITYEVFEYEDLLAALNDYGYDLELVDLIPEFNNDSIESFYNEFDDKELQHLIANLTGTDLDGDEIYLNISW